MNHQMYEMARKELYTESERSSEKQYSHTWTAGSAFEFLLLGFGIQEFIRQYADEYHALHDGAQAAFPVSLDCTASVSRECVISFQAFGQLFSYEVLDKYRVNAHTIRSPGDVMSLVQRIEQFLTTKNPLRGQFMRAHMNDGGFEVQIANPVKIARESLILPPRLTFETLERDIIYPLKHGRRAGAIFHGPPGTGKSRTCAWLAHRAIAEGFSVVLICSPIEYSKLQNFLRYLGPTLLQLEDIDTNISDNRARGGTPDPGMSAFLQTLSGVEQGRFPVSVVATTNDIECVNDALKRRPGRFNRIWKFDRPETGQMEPLIDVYFPNDVLTAEQRSEIVKYHMTGDLVRELASTIDSIVETTGCTHQEAFPEGLATLLEHFDIATGRIGFGEPSPE